MLDYDEILENIYILVSNNYLDLINSSNLELDVNQITLMYFLIFLTCK